MLLLFPVGVTDSYIRTSFERDRALGFELLGRLLFVGDLLLLLVLSPTLLLLILLLLLVLYGCFVFLILCNLLVKFSVECGG